MNQNTSPKDMLLAEAVAIALCGLKDENGLACPCLVNPFHIPQIPALLVDAANQMGIVLTVSVEKTS